MDNLIWTLIVASMVILWVFNNWLKTETLADKVNHLEHELESVNNLIDFLQRKIKELSNEMEKRQL